ncbi:MAG TPA: amino acid adenylation domain-containing protein, partial [Thermoanaerobaculia bacterium]|nr:amino acid adenylation domain-containing protein [Thermoanaerobaculia bacterium]
MSAEAHRWQRLAEWNDTAAPFPDGIALHEPFEEQARRAPGAVAVEHESGSLTYAELADRADQLARRLAALGAGPGSLVGIHLARSPGMIVAALAVLKAGAAYVPIESTWPRERVRFILESQRIAHLLTGTRELEALEEVGRAVPHALCVDNESSLEGPEVQVPHPAGPDDLAYVIFTSGSTGNPKGVMVRHRPAVNLIHWVNSTFGVGPSDRLLFITSLSFDLSVYDVFGTLAAGGTIRLASSEELRDPECLVRILTDEGITFWDSAPAALQQLVPFFPAPGTVRSSLRRVFLSGDWIPVTLPDRVRESFAGARVISLGGATEATIWSNVYPIGEIDPAWKSIPYGRPIANARYHVLDEGLEPCPVGDAGDLYIGGMGGGCLAAGYAGAPDLTADRFLPDPFSREEGGRLYRTGDRARYWPDGNLEFLGRLDNQVKIRGYRIELGEIEAAIAGHPGVEGAVVLAPAGPTGDRRLVAYVQPHLDRAGTVLRWLHLERKGGLEGQSFHELPDGTVLAHRNRSETEFLYREIFEEGEYFRHGIGLRDGDCVLDVGANIGLFTLLAGRAADVRIHAFEPIPPLASTLRVNAGLHGLDARVHDCGLSDEDGTAEFTYYPHVSLISGRHSDPVGEREVVRAFVLDQIGNAGLPDEQIEELLDERLRTERVACRLRTLSGVLAEEGIDQVGLLKIDVEKSEMEVLGGIRDEDWPKIRQVVVEVHDEAGRLERATSLLRRHGFEVFVEQETALTGSGFHNVYARRPGDEGEARPVRPAPAWTTPAQLIGGIRASLRERLPEYMLPTAFVLLEEFPVSANGKLDRKALPAPESVRHGIGWGEREHVAPSTPAEEALAAIWSEILGVERIGAHDSFLDLGGHSLLATQVLARVRDRMGVELTLRDVFDRPVLGALAALIEERGRAGAQSSPIVPVPRAGDLPLSFAQERVWFLQQLDPTIQSYQFQARIRFRGQLHREALRRSLEEIVRRHEIFRTSFPTVNGGPVQRFHPAWEVPLPQVDLSGLPADRREDEAERVLALECRRSFDVASLPLVRWTLVRFGPEDHAWLHAEHHLVHDGWSFNLLLEELAALYAAFREGRPSPLPGLPLQFADWAVWQREWMRGKEAAAQIEWWKRNLAGRPAVLELPTDRPRPRRQSFRGDIERLEMPFDLCAALRGASRREGVSLYMLMQAAFAALLSRHTGQEQVNVGSAVANRRWRETESMIGMIVDNVVLTNDLSGDPTVAELLRRVRRMSLETGARQDIPFDHVVEAVQPQRDLAYNPLFQASFSFHDSPLDVLDFPGLEAEVAEGLSNGSAKFDLNAICIPRAGGGITLLWEYATAL